MASIESKKGGFLKKILRKPSLSSKADISRTASIRSGVTTSTEIPDSPNTTQDNSYFDENDSEDELDDFMEEQTISTIESHINDDAHQAHEKVSFHNHSNINYDAEYPPWMDLTYESLMIPEYIKTSRKHKLSPRLNHLFLAQELNHAMPDDSFDAKSDHQSLFSDDNQKNPQSEILVMEFNKEGSHLASAGRDGVIKIWKVISSPLSRLQSTETLDSPRRGRKSKKLKYLSAPVFLQTPVRVFKGHTGSVISLDWSKNNFLITGSMDNTAKLWHIDHDDCLKSFKLNDFVTSLKFHPTDDRFFVSGSLDGRLLLWSILENSIAYEQQLKEVLITAITMTPEGEHIVAGGVSGSVFVLETRGLHIIDRIEVKNTSLSDKLFHNKNDNKITGVQCFVDPHAPLLTDPTPDRPLSNRSFLVTTNDSKIRLVNTGERKLVSKFKGLTNTSSSIVASTDTYHKFVISGSEDHRCYIWENDSNVLNHNLRHSVKEQVTKNKLAKLLSHDHSISLGQVHVDKKSDYKTQDNRSCTSFHVDSSRVNVAIFAPEGTKSLLKISDDIIFDLAKRGNACAFDVAEGELDGQIIVTADQSGTISVFRQDSAYYYRKQFIQMSNQGNTKGSVKNLLPLAKGSSRPQSPKIDTFDDRIDLDGHATSVSRKRSAIPCKHRLEPSPIKKLELQFFGTTTEEQNGRVSLSPVGSRNHSKDKNLERVNRGKTFAKRDEQNLYR